MKCYSISKTPSKEMTDVGDGHGCQEVAFATILFPIIKFLSRLIYILARQASPLLITP